MTESEISTYALVISLEYNQFPKLKLYGCYNDSDLIIERLKKMDSKINITLMRDNMSENSEYYPTKTNIIKQLKNLCTRKENKLFFFYSGHGYHLYDKNKDERTLLQSPKGLLVSGTLGNMEDSCFITNEIKKTDFLLDDEISDILTTLSEEKKLYAFIDCCNSGTMFDLYKVYLGIIKNSNVFSKGNELPFTNQNLVSLQDEINKKTYIITAEYPDKKNKFKANIILFSSCYDKQMSYKGYLHGKVCSNFTAALCWLLDNEGWNFNIGKFYSNLIALVNNKEQVPVLTSSKEIDLDKFILTDLKYPSDKSIEKISIPNFRKK
jgi:hypothetical protein